MQFEDVWGALERTIFQHYWSMSNGTGGLTNKYFSRLNLFQDISAGPADVAWTYLTADEQLNQIIDFAQTQCALPVQYGEVDPVWNLPIFAVKAISCAYALQLVMKPMPDMVTKMDYSTTPPTISFIRPPELRAGHAAFRRHGRSWPSSQTIRHQAAPGFASPRRGHPIPDHRHVRRRGLQRRGSRCLSSRRDGPRRKRAGVSGRFDKRPQSHRGAGGTLVHRSH